MLAICVKHGGCWRQNGSEKGRRRVQSLMKLANKKGNEVGPEVVDEIGSESVNVVSNTQLKVQPSHLAATDQPLRISL